MKTKSQSRFWMLLLITLGCCCIAASAQITPSGDAYTNTATPTTELGAKPLLDVESATQTTYIQFDLSSIPSGYTSASIAKATLKLYVNAVTTGGSFNVDYVNGTWSEKTITADLAPALGTTLASSVPLTSANVHDYIIIDITPALNAWLDGTEPNDGIALVANSPLNASFDSKENTATSQPPELDIVFAGGGTISGVTTASGSGLTGGGTSGTLNLALTNSCAASQVLQWNGSAWACAAVGTGTITGVTPGPGLLGGGTSGNVSLNLDTTKIPELASANTFTGNQTVNGNLAVVNNGTYQPFSVQSSSTFGSWMTLSNSSAGGHTWNIISAAGGNGEGAGNFAITDLTGKSTIWLEGNVNAGSLVSGSTAINNMGCSSGFGGIGFGANGSTGCANYSLLGEGINTYLNRPAGGQLLFRENNATEMVLASGGNVGIGTAAPSSPLTVVSSSTYLPALFQDSSTFGTWIELNNTSTGGQNWAILSAGSANSEGAGNLAVTNFTGASNINLEGNVKANTLSVNNDTPMSHNPHMSFSTMFVGSMCNGLAQCGFGTGAFWGIFVPDYNILITRFSVRLNSSVDASCQPAFIQVYDDTANQTLANVPIPSNVSTFNSGSVSIAVPGAHQLSVLPQVTASNCTVGASAGGDVYINTQYVMQ